MCIDLPAVHVLPFQLPLKYRSTYRRAADTHDTPIDRTSRTSAADLALALAESL